MAWVEQIKNLFRRFGRDEGGNLVILFAFLILPITGILGLAIDYSLALRAKTALDQSLDAALLASVTEAEQIVQLYSTPNYDASDLAIQSGTLAGRMVFGSNSAMLKYQTAPSLTLNLQRSGLVIKATGSYTASTPTVFGGMFGSKYMNEGGSAASSLTLPKYMNIYIVYDISQSMGIGATQTDMNNLSNLTGGCVFGCHVAQSGQSISNETKAHNNNVQLRIDVVRQSIQDIIGSAQNLSNGSPTIKIGLYSMQTDIATVKGLTTDYPGLLSAASQIDLGPNTSSGVGDTNFPTSLNDFVSTVTTSGDGSSSGSPQSFVFLLTDGVDDVQGGNCVYGHCTAPFDPSLCTPFKNKGATVGVIYTTYIAFPNEQTYQNLVLPFAPNIQPNLKSCSSAGYFYQASDGPGIRAAASALFAQATASGRLLQ